MAKERNIPKAERHAKKGVHKAPESLAPKRVFKNEGSSFESFLEEEGILDEVDAEAIKRVERMIATRDQSGDRQN